MKDRKFATPVSVPIEGFDYYTISPSGRVFSFYTNKFLKATSNGLGYMRVSLRKGGKSYDRYVHRLVAKAFINNKENKPQVNHKDLDKSNNHYLNLEWCTAKENSNHAEGTYIKANPPKYSKSNHPRSKLNDDNLNDIKVMYENGFKVTDISKKHKVHFVQIYAIIKRDGLQRNS